MSTMHLIMVKISNMKVYKIKTIKLQQGLKNEDGFFTYLVLSLGIMFILLGLSVHKEINEAVNSIYDEMYLIQCKYGTERVVEVAFKTLDLDVPHVYERRFVIEEDETFRNSYIVRKEEINKRYFIICRSENKRLGIMVEKIVFFRIKKENDKQVVEIIETDVL